MSAAAPPLQTERIRLLLSPGVYHCSQMLFALMKWKKLANLLLPWNGRVDEHVLRF